MKSSSATSAKATAPRRTDRSSDRPPPTLTSADDIRLSGPSDLPDPLFHAYRKDLADVRLASRVIASHYADPVERKLIAPAPLRAAPTPDADVIDQLRAGDRFLLLDDSVGWSWGYAGEEQRVGYIESHALS